MNIIGCFLLYISIQNQLVIIDKLQNQQPVERMVDLRVLAGLLLFIPSTYELLKSLN